MACNSGLCVPSLPLGDMHPLCGKHPLIVSNAGAIPLKFLSNIAIKLALYGWLELTGGGIYLCNVNKPFASYSVTLVLRVTRKQLGKNFMRA
jgi:hypothetical protein